MKKQVAIAIVLSVFFLLAGDIELIQFSDLRLRDKVEEGAFFGAWKLKGAQAGEMITVEPEKISGSDGCNRFSATLMMTEDVMKIGSIMSTRAFCKELSGSDEKFRTALSKVAKYKLSENGELQFLDGNDEVILLFVR